VNARRAAAAAVSATLSAAVATIVVDGQHAAPQLTASRAPAPSAMDSFMPVSVERPTGACPAAAHPTAGRPADVRPVGARSIGDFQLSVTAVRRLNPGRP
jgi:hypothetical protein